MKSKRGTVLLLMTLVLVVSAVYFSTVLFDIRGSVDQERLFRTKKQMSYLEIGIADFRLNNPDILLTDLDSLVTKPVSMSDCDLNYTTTFKSLTTPTGWCGPYVDTSLFMGSSTAFREDAWGTAFVLNSTGATGSYKYVIRSCGENTTCGDADDVLTGEI